MDGTADSAARDQLRVGCIDDGVAIVLEHDVADDGRDLCALGGQDRSFISTRSTTVVGSPGCAS